MAIIPILLILMMFLNKNNNSKFIDLIKNVNVAEILDLLKQFNLGGEYLSLISPELIESVMSGQLDIKNLLPLAIKFFANKKGENSHPNKTPIKMDFMNNDIKTALFNYLKDQ